MIKTVNDKSDEQKSSQGNNIEENKIVDQSLGTVFYSANESDIKPNLSLDDNGGESIVSKFNRLDAAGELLSEPSSMSIEELELVLEEIKRIEKVKDIALSKAREER